MKKIRSISTPTLFIHGTKDDVIPFEMSEKLYDQSPSKVKNLLKVEGGKHEDQYAVAGEAYVVTWVDFINKC